MAISAYTTNYHDDVNTIDTTGLTPLEKNYLRILFQPGRTIQARELNQTQSLIQAQIDRVGQSLFKANTPIVGGRCQIDTDIYYIDITIDNENVESFSVWVNNLEELVVTQSGSELSAVIVKVEGKDSIDDDSKAYRIFIKYKSNNINGSDENEIEFSSAQINLEYPLLRGSITATIYGTFSGKAVAARLEPGFYFVKGCAAQALEQYFIYPLSEGEELFTGFAVLKVSEKIITTKEDESLLDNAAGSLNYAGIGADRYQILLSLSLVEDIEEDKEYVRILDINDSQVIKEEDGFDNTTIFEDILAIRTSEESGDYVLDPFTTSITEVWNDGENGGKYSNLEDLNDAGFPNPTTSTDSFAFTVYPSTAYVKGYRVDLPAPNTLFSKKARESYQDINGIPYSAGITADVGNYVEGTLLNGLPNIDAFSVSYGLYDSLDSSIGTAKIQTIEGLGGDRARLYLQSIDIISGKVFSNVSYIEAGNEDDEFGRLRFNLDVVGQLEESESRTSLYKLPVSTVKSVSDIKITEKRSSIVEIQDQEAEFSLTVLGEIYDKSSTNLQVLFLDVSGGTETIVTDYDIIEGQNGQILTIDFTDSSVTAVNGDKCRILYSVSSQLDGSVSGTLGKKTLTQVSDYPINVGVLTGQIITLPGIYHLMSVDSDEFDVYTDGQSDGEYKEAQIISKVNMPAPPIGSGLPGLTVDFTHWEFSGGNYYTVNSYLLPGGVQAPLEDIPLYGDVSLSDTLDLRVLPGSNDRVALDPYSPISLDVDFYLPRRDISIVDTSGRFSILSGEAEIDPSFPEVPADSMLLHNISIPSYTFSLDDISIDQVDNSRYTMRDIGKLERRIGNLEYYTTLSLLEKSAKEASIYDTDGSRFKNGFVVDGFRGHDVGNPSAPEYRCSVRRSKGVLYPHHSGYSVPFIPNSLNQLEADDEYPNTGVRDDVYTLPYSEKTWMNQKFATQFISVQPHETVASLGLLRLNPPVDTWTDHVNRPKLEIDPFPGLNDSIMRLAEETGILGTEWDAWSQVGNTVVTRNDNGRDISNLSTRQQNWIRDRRGGDTTLNWEREFERTGVQTSLLENEISTSLGRNITGVAIKPFMRSRTIAVRAFGLQPNARFHAFFDSKNVDNFVSLWDTDPREEVTPGWESGRGREDDGLDEATLLAKYPPSPLKSDERGRIFAIFVVPESPSLRFPAGDSILKLTTSPRNLPEEETSSAEATFVSNGLKIGRRETIITTRVPVIDTSVVTERVTTNATIGKLDPVAQTFRVGKGGDNAGVNLTSVDVFFREKPIDSFASPVKIYLVATKNGYPSRDVIPGSQVVLESQDVNVSEDSSAATTFTFDAPIYLAPRAEYALVVFSTSPRYTVFISEMGSTKTDLLTGQIASTQSNSGVFFTSANKSTWTAYQNRDLKFKFRRAVFKTGSYSFTSRGKIGKYVDHVDVTSRGAGYTIAGTTVTFSEPTRTTFVDGIQVTTPLARGVRAEGEAIIDSIYGFITGITVTKRGWGYDAPPTVVVSDDSSTEDAELVAVLPNIQMSSALLNQNTVNIGSKTKTNTKLILGDQSYTITPNRPFEESIARDYTINRLNAGNTLLRITMKSDNDRVSPMVDNESLSLNVRKYYISQNEDETSKYLTKRVSLTNPANQIDAYLAINKPSIGSDIKVYVKLFDTSGVEIETDELTFDSNKNWREVSATEPRTIPTSTDKNIYKDVRFQLNLEDESVEFSSFITKIVFLSDNVVDVPTVKDLRVIATS